MKKCTKCDKEKSLSEFPKNRSKKDGHSYYCKECNRVVVKEHYYNNKELYYKKNERFKEKRIKWWNDLKSSSKCIKCGESHPACLEFHHIDPSKKEENISNIYKYWSKKRVLEEIEKCIVLCSNCHRKLHWEERQE